MIYNFKCDCGLKTQREASIHDGPPPVECMMCGDEMGRDWQADRPHLNTAACRDHDEIPAQHRVAPTDDLAISASKREQLYAQNIRDKRKQLRDGNRGSVKQTHAIPAELFHGKIRETGDREYWKDEKNLNRHKSTKVV